MTSDDDRIAYLAGELGGSLDADDQADLDALRDLLADPAVWAEPNPSLEDAVVAAVAAETARRGGGPIPQEDTKPRRSPARRDRHSKSRTRLLYGVAGVAAAVLAALAVALGVVAGGPGAQHYSAALSATGLAPGASGAANFTKTTSGWRVVLHSGGLPRRDNGRYYEAWMKNRAGVLVPIGTFNQGPTVTLWSAVAPTDFPTITVTQQVANGNPASSGLLVLAGSVAVPKSP